ncbi:Protein TIFY 6B [Rhynchospora pubera]|uniref:Protein TIFY n=1 Tax=Rhynchospora pubera TaxID=906938 RepID=A0AAV8GBB9_9POAL|nr:Protein TIFY 6B [Rhynchospora pubera]
MERDFLGVIGMESCALSKDEARSNHQDSVIYGNGSGVQWPTPNKTNPLPPFMSIKTIREEKSDQFSISGFQPKPDKLNANPRTSTQVLPQQYPLHGFGPSVQNVNGSRVFPVVSHHTIPFSQNNPFVKVNNSSPTSQNVTVTPAKQQPYGSGVNLNTHLVGSTVGVFVQREAPKPAARSQMTIFYAGSVCSFENIPMDKAKEILMLASKAASVTPPPTESPKVESVVKVVDAGSLKNSNLMTQNQSPVVVANSNLLQSQKQSQVVVAASCPVTSSPVSVVSHAAALSRSTSSSNASDSNGTKSLSPLGPSSQPEPSSSLPPKLNPTASQPAVLGASANLTTGLGTAASLPAGLSSTTSASIMPSAVPQARKASLARFLEKRKERVSCVAPYSKLSENGDASQSSNNLTHKPSAGIEFSRNDSFSFGHSNTTSHTTEAPSTELQI